MALFSHENKVSKLISLDVVAADLCPILEFMSRSILPYLQCHSNTVVGLRRMRYKITIQFMWACQTKCFVKIYFKYIIKFSNSVFVYIVSIEDRSKKYPIVK